MKYNSKELIDEPITDRRNKESNKVFTAMSGFKSFYILGGRLERCAD